LPDLARNLRALSLSLSLSHNTHFHFLKKFIRAQSQALRILHHLCIGYDGLGFRVASAIHGAALRGRVPVPVTKLFDKEFRHGKNNRGDFKMSNFEIATLKNVVLQGFSLKNHKDQFQNNRF
jgi:hypothetical protein